MERDTLYRKLIDKKMEFDSAVLALKHLKSGVYDIAFTRLDKNERKTVMIFPLFSAESYDIENKLALHRNYEEMRNGAIKWYEEEISIIKTQIKEMENELLESLKKDLRE